MDPNSVHTSTAAAVSRYNTRVLKEPRGMIRLIQLIFAILAFSTTASFDTQTSFTISCFNQSNSEVHYQKRYIYQVEYPFDFYDTPLSYLSGCGENEMTTKKLEIDFSSSAQFFVATGVLCFLYTIATEVIYIAGYQYYENNPFFPVVDLGVTALFALFWLAGASAWAINVSDIKYYAGPKHLLTQVPNCNKTISDFEYVCFTESPGKWSSLYISLIFGFANLFLWAASMWFVYKETMFHRKTLQPQPMSGYPGIATTTTTNTMNPGGVMPPMQQQQMMSQMGPTAMAQPNSGQYAAGQQYVGQSGY